jgi:hypothetical protein
MKAHELTVLRGEHLRGRSVEFSKRTQLNAAADTSLVECEISLIPKGLPAFRGGARFWFARVDVNGCAVNAQGRVHQLDLDSGVHLKHCRFLGGPYTEPKFGPSPIAEFKGDGSDSSVEDCDFTQADLRDARFYRTPIEELRLPGWPYITVVAREGDVIYAPPSKARPALTELVDLVAAYPWENRKMAIAMDALVFAAGIRDNEASVKVSHAEDVVKRGAGSLERLRSALDRFSHPAVRY